MSQNAHHGGAATLEELFRQHYGRVVSALVGRLGKQHFDLAEDAAQEALARAARLWPAEGAPREPAAWLIATARNYAIDGLRRDARFRDREADITRHMAGDGEEARTEAAFPSEITDDELCMMFFCCDPAAPRNARVALTLKVVCGFRAEDIARAFFVGTDAWSISASTGLSSGFRGPRCASRCPNPTSCRRASRASSMSSTSCSTTVTAAATARPEPFAANSPTRPFA